MRATKALKSNAMSNESIQAAYRERKHPAAL